MYECASKQRYEQSYLQSSIKVYIYYRIASHIYTFFLLQNPYLLTVLFHFIMNTCDLLTCYLVCPSHRSAISYGGPQAIDRYYVGKR